MPDKNLGVDIEGNARDVDETPRGFPELLAVLLLTTEVRAIVFQVGLSAVVWLLAVIWLNLIGGAEVDLVLAVVTGFFVMFLTLLLAITSMAIDDPRLRWLPQTVPTSVGLAPHPLRKDARRAAARPCFPLGVANHG